MANHHEIFDTFPHGVTLGDPEDGSILDANEQFCEMLGYTRDELLTCGFDDLHVDEAPHPSDDAKQDMQKAATEGSQTFEWIVQTKDGEPLPVEVTLLVAEIEEEKRILGLVRDITERKRQERQLQRENERLEQFASVVSHDLRNHLNVLDGYLQLAEDTGDAEHFDRCHRATDRMDELLEDMLTLARDARQVGEMEVIDPANYAESCWESLASPDASLELNVEQVIRADESRFRQLLENLLSNAMEHGGDSVTVTVGALDEGDGFYVADDGPGIPEEEQDDIFDAGYTTGEDGTGFGLAIAQEIADGHDWEIGVTDSMDGGARFEISGVEIVD
jgi:PAS domain S-box-containing protein